MKRLNFALAVLAMTALASCQINEFRENTYTPEKGEMVFRMASSATKSSDASSSVKGVVIPLKGQDGLQLYLEETITRLDDISYGPETKGTPAYTENFSALYGDFKGVAYYTNGGAYKFLEDGVFNKIPDKEMWRRGYGDKVVKSNFPFYFFLRAPYDLEGTAVKNLEYNTSTGAITFDYDGSSLKSASDQKDLLFTSREVTASDYDKLLDDKTGIPVLFHHALTGIKFANFFDNPDLDTRTYITKIEITGLAYGGKCVITPRTETNGYVDDRTGDYSSASVSYWNPGDLLYKNNGEFVVFSQTFDTTDEIDFAANGSFGNNKGSYSGTTFGSAGNLNNLNKADGSLTFWFVPQQLTKDVEMTITYNVVNTKNGNEHPDSDTIKFGDLTRVKTETTTTTDGETTTETTYGEYATWRAGELRTYTLKPQYVEVKIVDTMDEKKFVKSNVVVTNNGNVNEYVRVNIIGNWIGQLQIGENEWEKDEQGNDEQTILMGYAAETGDRLVEAWNDKDGVYKDINDQVISPLYTVDGHSYNMYGTFVGLPAKSSTSNPTPAVEGRHWVRFDKYYYYTEPLGPNQSISEPLFDSYTVNPSPVFWIPDKWGIRRNPRHVHLEMDLAVQAIPVPTDADGSITADYIKAWTDALNGADLNDL